MAKRIIEKKIIYLRALLPQTKGWFKRLMIKFEIWNQTIKLRKYKK